ncbi:MAG: hypothetical protein AAGH78_14070 [Cyanobacteria bacterium P01_H01_bin.58]
MVDSATTPDDLSVENGAKALDAVAQANDGQQNDGQQQVEYRLHSPRLPLAVYREVAAHLQQIDGVTTGLLPQTAKEFDYLQSQVGGLWIRYQETAAEVCEPQVEVILTYYGDRYGNWETLKQ